MYRGQNVHGVLKLNCILPRCVCNSQNWKLLSLRKLRVLRELVVSPSCTLVYHPRRNTTKNRVVRKILRKPQPLNPFFQKYIPRHFRALINSHTIPRSSCQERESQPFEISFPSQKSSLPILFRKINRTAV